MATSSDELHFHIRDGVTAGFDGVRSLRERAYGRAEAGLADSIDAHSFHVLASTAGGRVVGAMRVTCRRDGALESEQAYPRWLIDEFQTRLSACSRLCLDPDLSVPGLPLALMTAAWDEGLRRGVRIDASKVRRRAIPYYVRLGAYFMRGSVFTFDRWHVRCGLVAMSASPAAVGPLASLLRHAPEPVDIFSLHPGELSRDPREIRRELHALAQRSVAGDHHALFATT